MNRKVFFLLFLFAATLLGAQAQDAKAILDKTSETLKKAGGIHASFQTTTYKGNQANGTMEGELMMENNRYKLQSPAVTSWYDGKTQWTLMGGSNEVNVSTPTEVERQAINPYAFVDIYKSGYVYNARNITYNGGACYEVQLIAKDKNRDLQEVRLVINQANIPVSIRMKRKQGDWVRIRVSNVRLHQKFSADTFRFNPQNYPNVEVIDLR